MGIRFLPFFKNISTSASSSSPSIAIPHLDRSPFLPPPRRASRVTASRLPLLVGLQAQVSLLLAMRVHPVPRKRTIAVQRCAAAAEGGGKKLRRLPHIFAKVLELPFAADADVLIEEDAAALRFVVACESLFSANGAHAHAIEIHPGVTKVVVRGNAGSDYDHSAAAFELDRWRFRLPPCTRPAMATATYAEGELVVTVPKGAVPEDGDTDGGEAALLGGAGADNVLLFVQ